VRQHFLSFDTFNNEFYIFKIKFVVINTLYKKNYINFLYIILFIEELLIFILFYFIKH